MGISKSCLLQILSRKPNAELENTFQTCLVKQLQDIFKCWCEWVLRCLETSSAIFRATSLETSLREELQEPLLAMLHGAVAPATWSLQLKLLRKVELDFTLGNDVCNLFHGVLHSV